MSSRPTETNLAARFSTGSGEVFSAAKENLSGDFSRLLQQLGSPENFHEMTSLTHSWNLKQVGDLLTLKAFLENYRDRILLPLELSAITRASTHAARGEVREMIALDQQLASEPTWFALASASQRVGRAQLEELRPLRDQRVVQRYLAAVESGQAFGWHTVVYGLSLAIYSLPLRQGLCNYATQTVGGFISAASRAHSFSNAACAELLENLLISLPQHLEVFLDDKQTPLVAVQ